MFHKVKPLRQQSVKAEKKSILNSLVGPYLSYLL